MSNFNELSDHSDLCFLLQKLKKNGKTDFPKNTVIKMFNPASASFYFKLKYIKECHMIIDTFDDEKKYDKEFVKNCEIIVQSGYIPVFYNRMPHGATLYGWDKNESFYVNSTVKEEIEWAEEIINSFSQDDVDNHVKAINDNIISYDKTVCQYPKNDGMMQNYIKYLLFSVLVLTKSKWNTPDEYESQIQIIQNALYLITNECGKSIVPDSSLPENLYNKMIEKHIEERDRFIEIIKKCYQEVYFFKIVDMFTNIATYLWYLRKYPIPDVDDDYFVLNLIGLSITTIKSRLVAYLKKVNDDAAKTIVQIDKHRRKMLKLPICMRVPVSLI